MSLSNKAKNYIRKHRGKKKPKELAADLKVDVSLVETFLADERELEIADKKKSNPEISLDPAKKRLFTLITLLIPIIFFVSLEYSLRLSDYRGNTDIFIPLKGDDGKYTIVNPLFANRYFFYTNVVPNPPLEPFLTKKPENGFRVFMMGESSAAGYPYGFNGVPARVTKDMLMDALPDYHVEVITVATSAINSYTLYDQVDAILEFEPDAILIYTGHNEFYGALGVGSNESLGSFPGFVRMYLRIQRFKTFMLLRDKMVDFTKWTAKRFGSSGDKQPSTLMQQVVRDQAITLDSPVYELGKRQFRSNMTKIIEKFDRADVPVFIGSIASNLRDHPPFESIETENHPAAIEIYKEAASAYADENFDRARELFEYARDLDALKFRATTEFNDIIRELTTLPNVSGVYYVPVEERLTELAENNIIGFDLMLEHLHPNDIGYFNIGYSYFEALKKVDFLGRNFDLSKVREPDYYHEAMGLTELDHKIVDHRLIILTQSWPFVKDSSPYNVYRGYQFRDRIDSLAFEVVNRKKRWDRAKVELGEYYLNRGEYDKVVREFKGLMRDQHYNDSPFLIVAQLYLDRGRLAESYPYLRQAHKLGPSQFTYKMMGAVEVHLGNFETGIEYLEESLKLEPRDAQALFNLSGAYAQNGDLVKAYEIYNTLMEINPNFPGVHEWGQQLTRIMRQRGLL